MAKKAKAPPFVMIRRDMLKDPEWKELSNGAKILYIYLRSKFNHKTLSEVTLAYSEMKGTLGPKAMSRAFKELQVGKWIIKTKVGGLFGGLTKYKFIGKFKDFYYSNQRFKV